MRRHALLMVSVLTMFLSGSGARAAEPKWIKLTTPNFELYTTANEKRGREAILYFEQVRAFFIAIGQGPPAAVQPSRIVGFTSEKEFEPYRSRESTASFSFNDSRRDTVVMQKLDSEMYPHAVYHYVQSLLRQAGGGQPLWMRIGLAELYSTLKPLAGKVQVGAMKEGHRELLERSRLIDLASLLSADMKSPLYSDEESSRLFYAQSWALIHMLMLSDEYGKAYPAFSRALLSGAAPAAAFQQVYNKPLNRVRDELGGYMRGSWFKVVYFDTKLVKAAESPEVRPASAVESGLVLVSVLGNPEKQAEADRMLDKLAADHPESWEIAEAQGYKTWRRDRDNAGAIQHFARAAQLGSTNAQLYYDYASLLARGGSEDDAVAALKKALALQPDFDDARLDLGNLLYRRGLFAQVVATLQQVKQVSRSQAGPMYQMLALAYFEIEMKEEAKKVAERLLEIASNEMEITAAKQLIRHVSDDRSQSGTSMERANAPTEVTSESVDSNYSDAGVVAESSASAEAAASPVAVENKPAAVPEARPRLARRAAPVSTFAERTKAKPLVSVEGTLSQFDCLGIVARLSVMASGKRVALAISDPTAIAIRNAGKETLNFSCGRQQPMPVVIEYEERVDAKLGTVGDVRTIDLKQ